MGVCDHMTTSPDDSATINMPKASMAVTLLNDEDEEDLMTEEEIFVIGLLPFNYD